MNRWTLILSVAAICILTSAQARADFQLIRWASGFCQIWDLSIPGKPLTNDYQLGKRSFKTFDEAMAVKMGLVARGVCW
jgi:hypothetical protein